LGGDAIDPSLSGYGGGRRPFRLKKLKGKKKKWGKRGRGENAAEQQ